MSDAVKIAYPKENAALRWHEEPACFIAFGGAPPGVTKVSGLILNGAGQAVGEASTLRQPDGEQGFWMIGFKDIPFTKGEETYTLEVSADGDVVASSRKLKVRGTFGIDISYPLPDANVCTNFGAYGPVSEAGTVTCKLVKGSTTVSGTIIPYGTMWAASFSGVSPDTYENLTATVGSSSASHSNITVAASNC